MTRQQPRRHECYRCLLIFPMCEICVSYAVGFSKKFINTLKLQLGLVLGVMLAVMLGVGLQYRARLFTKDVNVLHLISTGIPVPPCLQKQHSISLHFFNPKWHFELTFFQFVSVCCSYSTHQCLSICFWWCQLWSVWFCIFSLFHGKSVVPFLQYSNNVNSFLFNSYNAFF